MIGTKNLWILFWGILVAVGLYCRPLIPIDETRYLAVAWEMFRSGDYLVPHINGLPYSHKPPLLFWLINVAWQIFGVQEWVARLVSPLFGFGSILLGCSLSRKLWPERKEVADTVPWLLLGSVIWAVYASLAMFDTMVVFFSLAVGLVLWRQGQSVTRGKWLLIGLLLGLGMLAKGPVIFVYTLPPMLLAPLWQKGGVDSWWKWYGGILLAVAVGAVIILAWALPAAWAGGDEYRQAILFSQTAGRAVKSFAHQRPFYWYLMLLPLLLFPWPFYPPAWRRKSGTGADHGSRFCLCMVLPGLLLLSLISGKQIHYILPLMPFMAIWVAGRLTDTDQRMWNLFPVGLVLLAMTIALPLLPLLPLTSNDAVILQKLPLWSGAGPLIGLCVLILGYRMRAHQVRWLGLAMTVMLVCLQMALVRPLDYLYRPDAVFKELQTAQEQGREVAVFPYDLRDQFQFSARLIRPVTVLKNQQELKAWGSQHQQALFLLFLSDKGRPQFLKKSGLLKETYKHGALYLADFSDLR